MYVPQNIQPLSGPSFAQIAAEMGLVEPKRSRRLRSASLPAQRTSRSHRVEVTAR